MGTVKKQLKSTNEYTMVNKKANLENFHSDSRRQATGTWSCVGRPHFIGSFPHSTPCAIVKEEEFLPDKFKSYGSSENAP